MREKSSGAVWVGAWRLRSVHSVRLRADCRHASLLIVVVA